MFVAIIISRRGAHFESLLRELASKLLLYTSGYKMPHGPLTYSLADVLKNTLCAHGVIN